MKRTLIFFFIVFIAGVLNAQKIYFVYLQTESGEPFFVRLGDKLYTSASSGYLILPRLVDSTYSFKLGFPGKNIDLDFSTTINKRDHGYLIKDFGEKGWGLFDLQSLSLQMSSSAIKSSAQLNENGGVQVNAFTEMLSKATDDPSLKRNVLFTSEAVKKDKPAEAVQKNEKAPEVTDALVKEENKPETIKEPANSKTGTPTSPATVKDQKTDSSVERTVDRSEPVYKKSVVRKLSGVTTAEGFESVFTDQFGDGNIDTVRILIAEEREVSNLMRNDSGQNDKKFLDLNTETKDSTDSSHGLSVQQTNKGHVADQKESGLTNNTVSAEKKSELKKIWPFSKNKSVSSETRRCPNIANNDDFLKLRRKMAAKTNDDGMLEEARKYFRSKCFTTEQVKNLSSMFLSDAGKYNFFLVAYDYTSDKENFSSLQSELNDKYYIVQFKAMVRN